MFCRACVQRGCLPAGVSQKFRSRSKILSRYRSEAGFPVCRHY